MPSSDRREVIMTHDNASTHVLLVEGETVISRWDAGHPRVLADYLRDGAWPDEWDEQDLDGDLGVIDDYGEVVGRGGVIECEERRRFLGVDDVLDQVVDARTESGRTQTELARAAGMTQPQLSDYLGGRKTITVETLERLAAALGRRVALEPIDDHR